MDFSITDEQRAFVDTVRRVCQKEFMPRAIKYLDGTWPAENMKRLGEIGVLGMSIPEEYGGSGMGTLDCVLVLEEIGKVCYPTAMGALGEVGTQSRIIGAYGQPIPRLFAAGENGSAFGHLYLSGGNIAECFVTGRIAGKGAAHAG